MSCKFCKKNFSSERSLSVHQKTTKSCLLIQERMGYQVTKKTFPCEYCSQEFTARSSLQYHIKKCSKKTPNVIRIIEEKTRHIEGDMDDKLEQLSSDFRNHREEVEYELRKKDEKIKELEEHIRKNKTPPKITNHITKNKIENNIGTNIEQQNITIYQIMSPEHVEDFFKKHYNLDTLLGGQKALARFVNDGFLKEAPVYLCGDRSRQKFYIVKDGKKMEDTDCEEILGLTSPGMPHVQDVYETALFDLPETVTEDNVQDNYQQIMTMDEHRSDFKSELSKIAPMENTSFDKSNFKNIIRSLRERSERLGLTERQGKI
jgi:hypothetical protein